jgi:hypothetical protein
MDLQNENKYDTIWYDSSGDFSRDIFTKTVYFAPTPNPFNVLNQQQNTVVWSAYIQTYILR